MKRFLGIAAFALLAGAVGGCMLGQDDEWDVGASVGSISGPGGAPLVMCRSIEGRLHGLEVAVFRVTDHENILAVKAGGRVLCVDDRDTVRKAGVVPIGDANEPGCSFCEGTPLPASEILDNGESKEAPK